jgi:hypothetical protein
LALSKLDMVIERLRALPADEAEGLADWISDYMDRAESVPGWHLEELRSRQSEPLDLVPEAEVDAYLARHAP